MGEMIIDYLVTILIVINNHGYYVSSVLEMSNFELAINISVIMPNHARHKSS